MTTTEFQKKYGIKLHRGDVKPIRDFLTGRAFCYTQQMTMQRNKQRFTLRLTSRLPEMSDEQIFDRLVMLAAMFTEIQNGQFFFRQENSVMRVERYITEGEYLFSFYLMVGVDGYKEFLAMGNGTVQESA